ncbi:hypothetical protein [Amycolatopsis sp. NPDC004079]|uniref:hypothetical protein n=1 Tax=Amycolatopsis sp. NPDC004079 TaxID=3154549 RepID=UPI0033A69F14
MTATSIGERHSVAEDNLTPSDSAILIVLMAEARPMLNTELKSRYRIDVVKQRREKLNRLQLVHSERSGPTYVHELDDKGWMRVHEDLDVSSPKARAIGGALAAVHLNLRDRVLPRTEYHNLAEMFSRTDIAPPEPRSSLELRLRNAYAALATGPRAWVALARLRPFFEDVPRAEADGALRRLARAPDVNLAPEDNQKALTDADRAAAIHLGGQDKHLLAIGV